jgi:hypothetical protein
MAKKGNKPKKPQGRCVFCDGTGLSKEHVWSDWLNTLIPKNEAHGESSAGLCVAAHTAEVTWTIDPVERSRQGPVISRKIRKVCEKCNNGWMSEAVNRAKPVVEKMALSECVKLSREEVANLAGWIALTNIMQEFANPAGSSAIPATDRTYLMQHMVPPESWSIWVGHYVGQNWEPFGNIHIPFKYKKSDIATEGSADLPDKFELQLSTFSVRHFLAHAFTSTGASRIGEYRMFVRNMHWNLTQIWPATNAGLRWPPAKSIEDVQLESIIAAWVQSETRLDNAVCARLLNRDIYRAMLVLRALQAAIGK